MRQRVGAGEHFRRGNAITILIVAGHLALAVVAAVCLFRLKFAVLRTLGITAAAGLALRLVISA